jgi:hypothetical protein
MSGTQVQLALVPIIYEICYYLLLLLIQRKQNNDTKSFYLVGMAWPSPRDIPIITYFTM